MFMHIEKKKKPVVVVSVMGWMLVSYAETLTLNGMVFGDAAFGR